MTKKEVWFVTGSQDLYGDETLRQVARDAKSVVAGLKRERHFVAKLVWKPTVRSAEEIESVCRDANAAEACIGLVFWMHTFSPAKMWINGLRTLCKPFVHLHTQFHRDLPWAEIDMDYMNLHQSAHGDREFGFICTRMRKERTVITGHWQDPEVREQLGIWMRAALGWHESQSLKIARFGDNMREVAVTEGDKVEAQMRLGYAVNGFGVGDLVEQVKQVTDRQLKECIARYQDEYKMTQKIARSAGVREQARLEVGMRTFLEKGGFKAFTTTFEDLHGLKQLPGLAVQRLMADGYGFGAEGDWKTAAMTRIMKVMGQGLPGGATFMEDYTYHLHPSGMQVLGAHMLELCPSIAEGSATVQVHPLSIGGKDHPARLVFNVPAGPAINVSPIDMGHRFRVIVNEVDTVIPPADLPKLPVARALWVPRPDLKTAATAWILAGGAHHTVYSQALDSRHLEVFCEMANMEMVVIDAETRLRDFKNVLRWNASAYR